jgi:hypothetical protein
MQKKLILFAGIFAFSVILNTSCSKDDDNPPAAKTKTQLITAAAWKYEKIEPALAETYIACFKDNTTTFTSDGKTKLNWRNDKPRLR